MKETDLADFERERASFMGRMFANERLLERRGK